MPGPLTMTARGNQGRDICADDRDRKLWLKTLDEAYDTFTFLRAPQPPDRAAINPLRGPF